MSKLKKQLRVAVIGIGSAGQSSSIFLKRQGHHVQLFEKVKNPQPVGAGFLLQPTAFVALKRLGIFDSVYSKGAPIKKLWGRTSTLRPVLDLDYETLDKRLHGLGLFRGTLFTELQDQLTQTGVPIHDGVEIVDVIQNQHNGTASLIASDGSKTDPFDLVIVADGARSSLRSKLHSEWTWRVSPYGWGTLYAIVPDPNRHFCDQKTLYQYFQGTTHMLGILPTGHRPKGEPDTSDPLVTMFWSLHKDQLGQWEKTELTDWKSTVRTLTPTIDPILEQISQKSQLTFATYWDVRMSSYHNRKFNNVVYIGDAAHAMSPVLGQGVNMALTDAMLLSDAIERHDTLKEALEQYTAIRKDPLRFYQWVSLIANPWFQSSRIPLMAFARDNFFASASSMSKLIQHQMILTLCGAKLGVLSDESTPAPVDFRFWNH